MAGEELDHQVRLAGAGVAADQDHPDLAGHRPPQLRLQPGQLGGAADEPGGPGLDRHLHTVASWRVGWQAQQFLWELRTSIQEVRVQALLPRPPRAVGGCPLRVESDRAGPRSGCRLQVVEERCASKRQQRSPPAGGLDPGGESHVPPESVGDDLRPERGPGERST